LFFLISAELFYRTLIPARQSPLPSHDPHFQLRNFNHTQTPSGFFSSGRWIQQRSHWTINQWGWNSTIDYQSDDQRFPHQAIVFSGDSQIEGFYVNEDEHIAARYSRLDQQHHPDRYVHGYSMASSGFTLGTYPTLAQYLKHHKIQPHTLVLLANPGDFKGISSLWGAPKRSRFPTYLITPYPKFSIHPAPIYPYKSTPFRRFMRQSALVRYLVFNARLNPFGFAQSRRDLALETPLSSINRALPNSTLNTSPTSLKAWRRISEADLLKTPEAQATFEFLVKQIKSTLPKTQILFLGDAPRAQLKTLLNQKALSSSSSSPLSSKTFLPSFPISSFVKEQCDRLKICRFYDPTPLFWKELKAGRRIDFKHNPHWNAHAHLILAHGIYAFLNPQ
jgi:hypothetical protein